MGMILRRTGLVVLFCLIVAPVIGLSLFSYLQTKRQLTTITMSRREALAALSATIVAERFARVRDVGTSLVTRVQFQRLINEGKWEEAIDILERVPQDFPFIDRVFITDPAGTLMADTPALPDVRGRNFAERDWYRGVSQDWQPYISEVYQRSAQPQLNVVAVATPIKTPDERVVGILVLQIPLNEFFRWTEQIVIGDQGFVYITDQRGRIVIHPNYSAQGEVVDFSDVPVVQKALAGERGVAESFNPVEQEARLAAYEPVADIGWATIVTQPLGPAYASRNETLQLLAAGYAIVTVLSLFAAGAVVWLMSRLRAVQAELMLTANIVASSDEAIIGKTLQGVVTSWNKGAESLYGYTAQEIIGQSITLLVPQGYPDEVTAILSRMRKGQVVEQLETKHKRKDGAIIEVSLTVSPIIDAEGDISGASTIARDITAHKEAQAQLALRTQELERMNSLMVGREEKMAELKQEMAALKQKRRPDQDS